MNITVPTPSYKMPPRPAQQFSSQAPKVLFPFLYFLSLFDQLCCLSLLLYLLESQWVFMLPLAPSLTFPLSTLGYLPMGTFASKPSLLVPISDIIDCHPLCSAVLADGVFPGPLIKANKVICFQSGFSTCLLNCTHQGDDFAINVINQLTDNTMDLPTTIVSISFHFLQSRCLFSAALARHLPKDD
jgi:hypothetical protein